MITVPIPHFLGYGANAHLLIKNNTGRQKCRSNDVISIDPFLVIPNAPDLQILSQPFDNAASI